MARLQPKLYAADAFAFRGRHLKLAGTHHGAVLAELQAIAIWQPGDAIVRRVERPEAQSQNHA
jgi:hypothetical protein